MKAVVFVPGIMGTELLTGAGEKLWPPKPLETQFGYGRTYELLGDDVRHGGIIENVVCFDVYGSLLKQFVELGFQQDGSEKRLYPFPYDWRLDLEHTAEGLASKLDTVNSDGARDIYLVAHSMGGLISRLVLETGTYANRPWFKKIRTFIAMATPHQGARSRLPECSAWTARSALARGISASWPATLVIPRATSSCLRPTRRRAGARQTSRLA
jgi:phospholipase A1